MSPYLDPINQAFADASSKGEPLYTKSYVEARQILEGIQKHQPAKDIAVEKVRVPTKAGEVETWIFRPIKATGVLPMIYYTHGGGWILGSPTVFQSLMEDLARQANAAVVFPYYTPAPDAQYPTQFEQAYGVLEYFVSNAQKHNIKATPSFSLAGDSVGGHMAIAMTQLSLERNLPSKVAHLVLFYPVTDTSSKSETYKTYSNGPYLTEKTMDWMIPSFLPNEADRKLPLTSPLKYAPDNVLKQFPPTSVFLSGADPLIGEGQAFGRRLQQLGVQAGIYHADGVVHDYVMLEPVRGSATAKGLAKLAALELGQAIA